MKQNIPENQSYTLVDAAAYLATQGRPTSVDSLLRAGIASNLSICTYLDCPGFSPSIKRKLEQSRKYHQFDIERISYMDLRGFYVLLSNTLLDLEEQGHMHLTAVFGMDGDEYWPNQGRGQRITKDDLQITFPHLQEYLIKLGGPLHLVESQITPTNENIPGKIPRIAMRKLVVQAAWEIEGETGRAALAKDVMARLQNWARDGEKAAYLIQSLPEKRAVLWRTSNAGNKVFDIEACGKALKEWMDSRQ